jgi:3-dehydroquinate synthase
VYNLDKTCISHIDNKHYYIFDASEENKTMDSVLEIIDMLIGLKLNKKNKLLVIGGGITQDVAGFVAAMFKRGLKWTLIPTTILSMTDSCIGAKVCLNRVNKNILSIFYAPDNIIVSDYFLKSLKHDDIISGVGESLKLSLIGGIKSYEFFKNNYNKDNVNYINLVKVATSVKKAIIEYDELEKNERKILNYGHTFGHALESVCNYFIPHGIAVIFGMYMINKLFYDNKYEDLNNYMISIIPDKFKKIHISYSLFVNNVLNDKKNDGDNICFIVLHEIGESNIIYRKIHEINDKLKSIFDELFIDV